MNNLGGRGLADSANGVEGKGAPFRWCVGEGKCGISEALGLICWLIRWGVLYYSDD